MKKDIIAGLLLMVTGINVFCSCSKDVSEDNKPSGNNANSHEYIDLGLTSGTLWATCNVGASKPEEYGDFFAWGETKSKGNYTWDNYMYCKGNYDKITKYCTNKLYGYNGFTDNKTELLPKDDAATVNWGSGWQIPSIDQFLELKNSIYLTTTWTTENGISGIKITSNRNGNSIFLPTAGGNYPEYATLNYTGSFGNYWSRSLYEDDPEGAYDLFFGQDISYAFGNGSRCYGLSVRPVRKK